MYRNPSRKILFFSPKIGDMLDKKIESYTTLPGMFINENFIGHLTDLINSGDLLLKDVSVVSDVSRSR